MTEIGHVHMPLKGGTHSGKISELGLSLASHRPLSLASVSLDSAFPSFTLSPESYETSLKYCCKWHQ